MKLVAADMDGTLLDSDKRLSPRLFPVIRELAKREVRFAVSSGRQYYTLLGDFPGMEEELIFLAENGGMVFDGPRNLFVSELDGESVREIIRRVRATKGVEVVLCGVNGAYIEASGQPFLDNVRMYYARRELVPDLLEAMRRDRICKLAVFDPSGAERGAYPMLMEYGDRFNVNLAGLTWVDLMAPGVSKGSAVRQLQQLWGIRPEDCYAFGDYLNDLTMMEVCGQSYAMANAHPDLKAVCRFEAKSNDEDGVVEALIEAFHLDREALCPLPEEESEEQL